MPRGQRKTATREDTEETRQTILRTAEQLFMGYGYRAVSTRQIADACGLTQPALYHYFADKQSLYAEVIKEHTSKTQAALERIVRHSDGVQERLRLVIHYLYSTTQHDVGQMLHDIHHELDAGVQSTLNTLFEEALITQIASIFEDGLQQGLLCGPYEGGVDAQTAAYLFMSMLSHSLIRAHYAANKHADYTAHHVGEIEQAEQIVHILLYGLAKNNVRA